MKTIAAGVWAQSSRNRPTIPPEQLKAILKATLVDGRQPKEVAAEHGLRSEMVSAIQRGIAYTSLRAALIKELRAEGHKVTLR